ncbi:germination protein YpeB [Rubeoparvulum massiliense]|uniref:germination protein YpeB n=1 Tax=Rubeoparvulum massiliense TaxID=1631346 RepID=UPI00065E39FD|nr:germination protein YpeB [Rubeoparvulum massiliense]
MYRNVASIFFPVFVIGFLIMSYWGYGEKQEKDKILVQAENQYQSAFHSLSNRVDKIQSEIGRSLAVNSERKLSKSMLDIWRISHTAHNDVGALPLGLLPLQKTEDFLTRTSNFTYQVAVRDLSKEPLTKKEYETLQKLYGSATKIKNELQKVQGKVLSDNIRWLDTEKLLISNKEPKDNTIIDGFNTIEKHVADGDKIDWGPNGDNSKERLQKKMERNMKGPTMDKTKVEERALQFMAIKKKDQYQVTTTENGEGKLVPSYHVRIEPKNGANGSLLQLDVAKRGGQILWMMNHRQIGEPRLNLEQAHQKALQFLAARGFSEMQVIKSHQYGNVAQFIFIETINDVLIYPDEVTVKVALDDGSIIGYQGEPYAISHHSRQLPPAKLTLTQAKKEVNPRLSIEESRLVVIENELGKEVLCYEFTGSMNQVTYQIYINAHNGDEEEVIELKNWDDLL